MSLTEALVEIDNLKGACDTLFDSVGERVKELTQLIYDSVDRQDVILNDEDNIETVTGLPFPSAQAKLANEEHVHDLLTAQLDELESLTTQDSYERLRSLSYYI